MPLSRPAIASLTIFTFVGKWNDFLGPLIYLNTDNVKTLQLGMRTFQTQYNSCLLYTSYAEKALSSVFHASQAQWL